MFDNSVTTGRLTQRERRERAEEALLVSAAELIVAEGPTAVTLARVGERAGYSRGIASHHFGSKQGLLDALVRRAQSGFVPGLADRQPGLERLLALIEGYIRRLGDGDVRAHAFVVLWGAASADGELAALFRERDAALRADVRGDIVAGLADGTVHPDIDPDEITFALFAQLRALALQLPRESTPLDAAHLARTVRELWRRAVTS
ncbi:TetR/AcrR family transcriptional regulator [Streptomyces phaeochromogenes]|uniref:TetR/AcrR family transcriptional regulator n=1 Tax=Streptomyces phaeochromogenes TaxID=1923 RepID=UPI00386C2E00|nr:TetR/AcrR family transcriptional regulator [Streptomyces phaeochromogenes]